MEMRDLPPPGPERDAEICLLLGETSRTGEPISLGLVRHADGEVTVDVPAWSTDAAACDALAEMVCNRAAFWECVSRYAGGKWWAWFNVGPYVGRPVIGTTRPDAVSAAALLAIRGKPR